MNETSEQNRSALRTALGALLLVSSTVAACQTGPVVQPNRGASLTRSAAVADIRLAVKDLEEVHPNVFFATSRSSFLRLERELIHDLPSVPTQVDVFVALCRLVSTVEDGHVSVSPPYSMVAPFPRPDFSGGNLRDTYFKEGARLLPFSVRLAGPNVLRIDKIWSESAELQSGERVLTMNGQDAMSIFHRVERLNSGEPADRQNRTERALGFGLWGIGIYAPFAIEVVTSGGEHRKLKVGGISLDQYSLATRQANGAPAEPLRYELLPSRIGLLEFSSMSVSLPAFKKTLESIFQQIQRDAPKGLIVDIRRNGGGNSDAGEALLNYINAKPYRLSAGKDWKVSDQCKAFYRANGSDFSGVKAYLSSETGTRLIEPEPMVHPVSNPLRYLGPVVVLIGPETFSSANQLANAIRDFNLAPLMGQPTAERANHFGELCGMVLPESRIKLFSSSAVFTRANGDATDTHDVLPDVVIPSSTTGEKGDSVLKAAEESLLAPK